LYDQILQTKLSSYSIFATTMTPTRIFYSFLFLQAVLNVSIVVAQGGHYWSENYGNRSMLLSGTVNASVEDLGTVFYNPGRLGLIENPAFVISAKVYEWKTLKIEDAGDEELDLKNSDFGGAPSLAAGTFKLPFLEGHKFAYSFLTRQRANTNFFARVEKEGDVVDVIPGSEIFIGKLDISTRQREEWIGLTWAPPTSKRISFGLSTFLSNLSSSKLFSVDMNAINEENLSGYLSETREYSFGSYGLLWKAGLAIELEKVKLGLTLTTPKINVGGKGSVLIEDYLVGVDTTGNGDRDDGFVYSFQKDLKVSKKSPWAVGVGLGIPFTGGTIHMSGEWYSSIPEHEVMSIEPFEGQSTGDTVRFILIEEFDPVFNFGIGIDWAVSEKVSAFASFASDFSAVPSEFSRFSEFEERTNNSTFQVDFFQFGGGLSISTKSFELTIGATYRSGSESFISNINFPDEIQSDNSITSKMNFSQWRFILGFSFPFADKLAKNFEGGEVN